MNNKLKGTEICPVCGGRGYPDTYRPPDGIDPHTRRYTCSGCPAKWYVVIEDQELWDYVDKQVFGKLL